MSPMDFLKFLIGLALLAIVGYFYNNWAYRDKDDYGPEMTGHATVTSKRVDQGRYLGKAPSRWNCLMTFSLSDGEEVELYVTQDIFSTLKEGMSGQLTWQGKRFYHFDLDV